jgi:hypothetical protein
MTDGKVANQQSLQVTTMKENLNDYKFIIACCDSVLNTTDPIKTAVAHAGLYTSIYAILLLCNPSMLTLVSVLLALYLMVETFIGKFNEKVFANRPFTEDQEARFHAVCSKMVACQAKCFGFVACMSKHKADAPYRFLTFALPVLATTAYIGKKISIASIMWAVLMVQCAMMVPQVSEKCAEINGKISGMIKKKKPE